MLNHDLVIGVAINFSHVHIQGFLTFLKLCREKQMCRLLGVERKSLICLGHEISDLYKVHQVS